MKRRPVSYSEFVTQSREVLGLPEQPAPVERLNPPLHDMMKEALALSATARKGAAPSR